MIPTRYRFSAPKLLATLLLAAALGGCASPEAGDTDQPPAAAQPEQEAPTPVDTAPPPAAGPAETAPSADSLAVLRQRVREVVGDSTCTAVTQCRAIAYGAKPCGGPWSYLVYSTPTTDSVRLAAAVEDYNAYEAALNEAEGRVSDCGVVAPPELACRQGQCVAVRGGDVLEGGGDLDGSGGRKQGGRPEEGGGV